MGIENMNVEQFETQDPRRSQIEGNPEYGKALIAGVSYNSETEAKLLKAFSEQL